MRNLNKYILLLLVVSIFTTSCEDLVDIEPTNIIVGDASTITDLDRARRLLNGGYAALGVQIGLGDLGADNNKLAGTNTGQGVFTHNWQYDQSTPIDFFAGSYSAMRDINVVLSVIDVLEITDDETDERDQIKAEALALRAHFHFLLAKGYSPKYDASSAFGIPLSLAPVEAGQTPPRASVAETFAQINADLDEAIALFPGTATSIDFFSKGPAHALKAEVAMWQEEWATARTNAQAALTESGISISSLTEFPSVWSGGSDAGVIMEIPRAANAYVQTFNRVTNEDIFYFSSNTLYNTYADDDVRKDVYFTDNGSGDFIISKWPTVVTQTALNLKLFRAATMHLIIAEASAELGDLGEAAAQINAINSNRQAAPTTVSYSNSNEALEDIYTARRLELAFEGDRFFQLKRLGLGVNRPADDCLTVDCTLQAGDFRFTLPIPEAEIFANPNMTQFPGY